MPAASFPSSRAAQRAWHEPPGRCGMSLIVAVAGRDAVALAADSQHVDVVTGAATTGFEKVVAVGDRLVGVTGISDWNGYRALDWARTASATSSDLAGLPAAFAAAAGPPLLELHRAWRAWAGPHAGVRDMLTVVVAGMERGAGTLLELWLAETDGVLVLIHRQAQAPAVGPALVRAVGSVDDEVHAVTAEGDAFRTAQRLLYREQVTDPYRPATSADRQDLQAWAVATVDAAVAREGTLPRPPAWPDGVPVLAAPVLSVSA